MVCFILFDKKGAICALFLKSVSLKRSTFDFSEFAFADLNNHSVFWSNHCARIGDLCVVNANAALLNVASRFA